MSINRVNISGNLTRDPELRSTQGGTSVLSFGVAVNDRRKNPSTGEWEDVPNYIDCTAFGNRADGLSKWLRKGTKVAIEGKLRWSQWQDKESGRNRSKVEVIVDECVMFLPPRQQGNGQVVGYQQAPAPAPAYQQPAPQPQQQYAQQAPQAPNYAPQQPQGYQNPPAQGYAQNQAPQAPAAPPAQAPAYQQQPYQQQPYQQTLPQQPAPQAPQMEVYDEDIPF